SPHPTPTQIYPRSLHDALPICLEILGIIKGRCFEPVRLKQGEVSRVPPVFPARDVALGHAGGEPLRVRDHPIGEQAAAASASNRSEERRVGKECSGRWG